MPVGPLRLPLKQRLHDLGSNYFIHLGLFFLSHLQNKELGLD